jgi:anti-sigma B factor antagonist
MSTNAPPASIRGFSVQAVRTDDAMVVQCRGKLTFEHAPQLRNKVRTLIPEEQRIVIDLKEVPFMDSSGLGTLVSLYVSGRSRGSRIELTNVSPALSTLLSMANVLSLFESCGRYGGKLF